MSNMQSELSRAAALTFECLSFMLPADDAAPEDDAPAAARAQVRFTGPFDGGLVVMACESLLPALTANMLGAESPPPGDQQLDALGEVANVVCGNLLPVIGGAEQIFRIEAPRVEPVSEQRPPEGNVAANTRLRLDEGWVELWLLLDA